MRTERTCPWYLMSLGLGLALTQGEAVADSPSGRLPTATPIKHLVVIYLENSSLDRYFGVYPAALNPKGSPRFEARPGTPSVNGLSETLLDHNPNLNNPVIDGAPAGSNPFRIARLDGYTCGMNHNYTPELEARNQGLMNQYVEFGDKKGAQDSLQFCSKNSADQLDTDLGYFDGNTVTALWNYAQHFAISDYFFATSSGKSTRGHLNLVAGDIFGVQCAAVDRVYVEGSSDNFPECGGPAESTATMAPSDPDGDLATLVDDTDGFWDVCSEAKDIAALTGRNIGDLLNAAGIPWGWFMGGFAVDDNGDCTSQHFKVAYCAAIDPSLQATCKQQLIPDYVPHHNPFQLFQSTANPQHRPPSSVSMVGLQDQANHLYDLSWFWQAAKNGNLPAVSFLKPPKYQNGHPGTSEPLDEQFFIVDTLNKLQRLPEWRHVAVTIAWDDSDGWYDHVMPPIVNRSATSLDVGTTGEMLCASVTDGAGARCSYGPRLPFLVISPWAKENYVSSVLMDQTSILRFIEDNWLDGERISDNSFDNIAGSIEDLFDFSRPNPRKLFLDPSTGEPMRHRRL
jgi:phospholipase C